MSSFEWVSFTIIRDETAADRQAVYDVVGWAAIFVFGSPKYYQRFGFDVEATKGFSSPYAGAHVMLLRLSQTVPTHGDLRHAPAFAALD